MASDGWYGAVGYYNYPPPLPPLFNPPPYRFITIVIYRGRGIIDQSTSFEAIIPIFKIIPIALDITGNPYFTGGEDSIGIYFASIDQVNFGKIRTTVLSAISNTPDLLHGYRYIRVFNSLTGDLFESKDVLDTPESGIISLPQVLHPGRPDLSERLIYYYDTTVTGVGRIGIYGINTIIERSIYVDYGVTIIPLPSNYPRGILSATSMSNYPQYSEDGQTVWIANPSIWINNPPHTEYLPAYMINYQQVVDVLTEANNTYFSPDIDHPGAEIYNTAVWPEYPPMFRENPFYYNGNPVSPYHKDYFNGGYYDTIITKHRNPSCGIAAVEPNGPTYTLPTYYSATYIIVGPYEREPGESMELFFYDGDIFDPRTTEFNPTKYFFVQQILSSTQRTYYGYKITLHNAYIFGGMLPYQQGGALLIDGNIVNSFIDSLNNPLPFDSSNTFKQLINVVKDGNGYKNCNFINCGIAVGTPLYNYSYKPLLDHCNFFKGIYITNIDIKLINSIASENTGLFLHKDAVAMEIANCVIDEKLNENKIPAGSILTNVLSRNPKYVNTNIPYNLRIKSIKRGYELNSPALKLANDLSVFGGQRDAGAYDQSDGKDYQYDTVTIIAPWKATIQTNDKSDQNFLADGSTPIFSKTKLYFTITLDWDLHLNDEEINKIYKILYAQSRSIILYPAPIAHPDVFLAGYINRQSDLSNITAITEGIHKNLKLKLFAAAPDTATIRDYL